MQTFQPGRAIGNITQYLDARRTLTDPSSVIDEIAEYDGIQLTVEDLTSLNDLVHSLVHRLEQEGLGDCPAVERFYALSGGRDE